jgi:DNA-binding NarL/FixJ family response regulator
MAERIQFVKFIATKMKVLIVDNHALFRRAFIYLLKTKFRRGTQFIETANGLEALNLVKTTKVDLIFLDISMPVMNGFEAIQQIKLFHSAQRVIVLTQYDEVDVLSYFHELGASFLTKNADESEIGKAINAVINGQQYIQSSLKYVKRSDIYELKRMELTNQERKLIQLLNEGRSSKEIAGNMELKPKTIETYRERLFKKTHVKNVAELISFAFKHGIMNGK